VPRRAFDCDPSRDPHTVASIPMLRVDKKARFVAEGAWFWKRFSFRTGKLFSLARLKQQQLADMQALQREQPVPVLQAGDRQWWWFQDCFYWEDEFLTDHDVMALVMDRERRKERKLERAHAALRQEADPAPRREFIPVEVRKAVFDRDGGRCRTCGSNFDIQYDHILPFSMGGSSTVANMQILCASCNRDKGASL
jgi:5-methylcytosine-specific restriction endonuclease McrA